MSDQLALDVGARQVSVETSAGRFTVLQFAVVAKLTPKEAREYLEGPEGFEELGVVERVAGGWRFTEKGLAIAASFKWWGTDE